MNIAESFSFQQTVKKYLFNKFPTVKVGVTVSSCDYILLHMKEDIKIDIPIKTIREFRKWGEIDIDFCLQLDKLITSNCISKYTENKILNFSPADVVYTEMIKYRIYEKWGERINIEIRIKDKTLEVKTPYRTYDIFHNNQPYSEQIIYVLCSVAVFFYKAYKERLV